MQSVITEPDTNEPFHLTFHLLRRNGKRPVFSARRTSDGSVAMLTWAGANR